MILLSWGAPLIPAGGSCCNLLKSLINRFLAGVDILTTTLHNNTQTNNKTLITPNKILKLRIHRNLSRKGIGKLRWFQTDRKHMQEKEHKLQLELGLFAANLTELKTTKTLELEQIGYMRFFFSLSLLQLLTWTRKRNLIENLSRVSRLPHDEMESGGVAGRAICSWSFPRFRVIIIIIIIIIIRGNWWMVP